MNIYPWIGDQLGLEFTELYYIVPKIRLGRLKLTLPSRKSQLDRKRKRTKEAMHEFQNWNKSKLQIS